MALTQEVETSLLVRRRARLAWRGGLGIDHVRVVDEGHGSEHVAKLQVHFIQTNRVAARIATIRPQQIVVRRNDATHERAPLHAIRVGRTQEEHVLAVELHVDAKDPRGRYALGIADLDGLDPFFSEAPFALGLPSRSDANRDRTLEPLDRSREEIDYLARDYESLRRILLDRLSVHAPDWQERHATDLGQMVVELLAYHADYASYWQDAVATEAYLSTARRRVSVARHARLLDYRLHEGCNARVWLAFAAIADATLPAGVRVRTEPRVGEAVEEFQTMRPVAIRPRHNTLQVWTWGGDVFSVAAGATSVYVKGELTTLNAGDLLIFEQVSALRGVPSPLPPCHAVKLSRPPRFTRDALFEQSLTLLEWDAEDALPRAFPISVVVDGERHDDVSVLRGNIALADHGRTIVEPLEPVPADRPFQPELGYGPITCTTPLTDERYETTPAQALSWQSPELSVPSITLTREHSRSVLDLGTPWVPRGQLASSQPFERHFVVEVDRDRTSLRFGDGRRGHRPSPGARLTATYRVGGGARGNVGANTLVDLVRDDSSQPLGAVATVRNPLPASGGVDPRSIAEAKRDAPAQTLRQRRCVTFDDYVRIAEMYYQVDSAAVHLDWVGDHRVVVVHVRRIDGLPEDEPFLARVAEFLDGFRTLGADVLVRPPRRVTLDIALGVVLCSDYLPAIVLRQIDHLLSDRARPEGVGFFHPSQLAFGAPFFQSRLVSAIAEIDGVRAVQVDRFRRLSAGPESELVEDVIELGPTEVVAGTQAVTFEPRDDVEGDS